jgi:hypothetical protein
MAQANQAPEVPDGIIRELRVLLKDNQPLLAIDKLMKETEMTLLDSINYVENLGTTLSEIVPQSVEKTARIFLHRGQVDQAIQYINEQTELDEYETNEYIEDLQPSVKIRIPIQDEQEIVAVFRAGNEIEAIHRVRALNSVGLKVAMEYLNLVAKDMNETNSTKATQSSSRLRGTGIATQKVSKSINQQYDQANWKGIAKLLSFYGAEGHEREQERVQLAILDLAKGDVQKLPRLVASAKEDYRDILWWHKS